MILVFATAVGLAVAVWNAWQRLGRTPRARAWSRNLRPDVARNVLVLWPLFALACLLSGVVGWAPDGPVLGAAILVLLVTLLTFLAYLLLPLPVPGFVKPRWYADPQRRARGARA